MARYYDDVADGWFQRARDGESSRFGVIWDAIVKLLAPYIEAPVMILDIGTGPGFPASLLKTTYGWECRLLEHIAPRHPIDSEWEFQPTGKQTIAVDLSPEMLKVTREHTTLEDVLVMDGRHLGFQESHFDLVSCIGVFEYVDNLKPYFEEARRVLCPDGLYLFSFFNAKYIEPRNGGQYPRAVHTPFRVFRLMNTEKVALVEFTTLREQREVLCLARNKKQ